MEPMSRDVGHRPDGLEREWTRIMAQAWADPDFRDRLEKNPRAVLKERGVNIPANVHLSVVEKPVDLEDIERAVKPLEMAVAAGFASAPVAAAEPDAGYSPFPGTEYGGGYPPAQGFFGGDPTLEGKGKVGLCISSRATAGACAFFQWGAAQPYPQQPMPQAPMPAASYAAPQPQPFPQQQTFPQQPQSPESGWAGDPYMGGVLDPTLEGKGKVGLCISSRATAGACAFFQWGAAQPYPQQPMPPPVFYAPQQLQQPPAAGFVGDPYAAGAMDPTLEGKGKVGLCISSRVTAGVCAYVHWGAAQPYPAQQPMPPQAPAPPVFYAPQQPPAAGFAGDPYAAGAMDPTLEGKGKVGLCISSRVTAGVCAYVHWGAAQPYPAQQPMPPQAPAPPVFYAPQQPPAAGFAGDPYAAGAMDPTLEGKGKVGLCISSRVTAGVCAYVHWGAAQPYPAQQPMPQPPMPAACYAPPQPQQPQQPPAAAWGGDPYSTGMIDPTLEGKGKVGLCIKVPVTGGVCAYVHWGAAQPYPAPQEQFTTPEAPGAFYGTPAQPQPPTAGWTATVSTPCFSGAASPPFVPPGHPSRHQFHIQPSPSPSPGPQTRPAHPGSA